MVCVQSTSWDTPKLCDTKKYSGSGRRDVGKIKLDMEYLCVVESAGI